MGSGFNTEQQFYNMGMQQQQAAPAPAETATGKCCPECGDPFDNCDII